MIPVKYIILEAKQGKKAVNLVVSILYYRARVSLIRAYLYTDENYSAEMEKMMMEERS